MKTRLLAAALALSFSVQPSTAQETAGEKESLTVSYVMFGVTPLKRYLGGPAPGASWTMLDRIVAPGGLRLEVDGESTSVDVLAAAEDPLELEILRDESRSMDFAERVSRSQELLRCFIDQLQGRDVVRVAGFAEEGAEVRDAPTADRNVTHAALGDWPTSGATSLLEALVWLARDERPAGEALRRISLVVTDGGDNASRLSLRKARELLGRIEHPIIVLDAAGHERPYDQSRPTRASLLLDEIVRATGGLRVSTAEPETACLEAVQLARSHLLVGFPADPASPNVRRRLRVRLAPDLSSELRLRYRPNYIGHAPLRAGDR
ncbi:MAG: hypothetical protein AAGK22_17595 [Acidobacteriota bacterium]